MTMSRMQFALKNLAGQVRASRPLALALPCAAMAFALLAVTVLGRAPDGPKCIEPALSAPGFDSLSPQVRVACIRIRF